MVIVIDINKADVSNYAKVACHNHFCKISNLKKLLLCSLVNFYNVLFDT